MSYVVNDPNNRKRLVFTGLDRKRRTIRLGKMTRRDADKIAEHVDAILAAEMSKSPLPKRTAEWLGDIENVMHGKLVRAGLVPPRAVADARTLKVFLDEYLARRRDTKPGTRVFYGHTVRNLTAFFGDTRVLEAIVPAEADDFRRWLVTDQQLSPATVARRCGLARTFFRDAVRRKLIDDNPFDGVGGGPKNNRARSRFIDRATIARVIEKCPNSEWRCLVALSRFGGLRVPSEALLLRWEDIDWQHDRMLIHSPKTEHHDGKATRYCPIFPELRDYLNELDEVADDGAVYVLEKIRPASAKRGDWKATNLRTEFLRIIRRAGVEPWPRLWHNLRASRQTDLVEEFPAHVVAAWLGNTERIAKEHYLQVLDAHFEKAARIPARTASVSERKQVQAGTETEEIPFIQRITHHSMGGTGFEPVTFGV